MKLPHRFTAFALAAAALGMTGLAQQPPPTFSGRWQGTIKVPGQDVVVIVNLAKSPKGEWMGSFSMPELGATDIPLDKLAVAQTKVHFLLASMPGNPSFDGSLGPDGREMSGTFSTAQSKSPLTLKRIGEAQIKPPTPNTPLSKDFEGTWHATLDPGDTQIRLLVKLTRAADGTASGTVVSVDQANREVPLTSIQQKDRSLDFEIRSIAVRFHGTLNNAANAIAGAWEQMSRTAPVTFHRGAFPPNSPLSKAFEGTWQASLDTGEAYKVLLALKLTRAADGTSAGLISNAYQAGKDAPVTNITIKDKSLQLAVQSLAATYSGTLNDAGTEIAGTWHQLGTAIPLTFKRTTPAEKKP
ncbi:MAG: hypothetical protein LAQ69_41060 [Acidobacteriia bacterium]|nr:hypothetical protein [Terriglobia bacterium]